MQQTWIPTGEKNKGTQKDKPDMPASDIGLTGFCQLAKGVSKEQQEYSKHS